MMRGITAANLLHLRSIRVTLRRCAAKIWYRPKPAASRLRQRNKAVAFEPGDP